MTEKKQVILLTGADGYVGTNLRKFFLTKNFEVFSAVVGPVGLDKEIVLDITKKSDVDRIVKSLDPDIIIHTAGLSSLAACEKNPDLARQINFFGTKNLVDAAGSAKFIFFSSDYVFAGNRGGYSENDPVESKTVYGKTKIEAEDYIGKNLKNYIIIRTANIFGNGGGNFFNFVLDVFEKKENTEVFGDVFFTPTEINFLIESIHSLVMQNFSGTIHIAGSEKISRYDFALRIAEQSGGNAKFLKKTVQPRGGLILADSSLDTKKLVKIIDRSAPTIDEAISLALGNTVLPYFNFRDERGCILGVTTGYNWQEINYIESKNGTVRGGHYHKKATEGFFVIEGKIRIDLSDIKTGATKKFCVKAGDCFFIAPNQIHVFTMETEAKWINMLSVATGDSNKDIYKFCN